MKICCIKTMNLPQQWIERTSSLGEDFFSVITDTDCCWTERAEAETDSSYKQIIPYMLFQNQDGRLLCYRRQGSEKRLHGLYSCGIGGHIEESDAGAGIAETVANGMMRELSEELTNYDRHQISLEYRGIIFDADTAVGAVHLGLVYLARCTPGFVPLPGEELAELEWKTRDELNRLPKESWADLALALIG